MSAPYFFGYGSLVNTKTHAYSNAQPARLAGYKRVWVATDLRPFAFLSAEPDAATSIQGLIAHVPNDDWAALDQREFAYARLPATSAVTHPLPDPLSIAVYSVAPERRASRSEPPKILLSYLDVVIQGYRSVFGETGVADFFATTHKWGPVLNDRASPAYPRHQRLSAQDTALVDQFLAAQNIPVVPYAP
ncbi:Gamma-glutamyl cyclotransferase, AIG2-like [Shimia haliotis]|uniref:Gamma-glutamyl cyclotransferase, AIG2-like n=2 Tax=Shimia haliotis TaxID=1280847 RepID=A0A1I4CX58_9RHOB|nr:Gamma-glutamyl cyclotransferase, AIG2-like [Shimia haliotis]